MRIYKPFEQFAESARLVCWVGDGQKNFNLIRFNLILYIYSIAIDAASGRFKLNGRTKP